MKTASTETNPAPKQRFWISCFVILLGLPFLFYFGYCWGLWGRDSLLLQYLFQCGCPVSSDEMRYPERVDVVVPACHHNVISLSPSGRFLYVGYAASSNDTSYLLDLQTGKKTPVSTSAGSIDLSEGSIYFLNDVLIYHYFKGEIIDLATGKQYLVKQFRDWRSDAYIGGEVNLPVLVEGLRAAQYVFLVGDYNIVTLTTDSLVSPEHNFFSSGSEQFLREQGIPYIHVIRQYEELSPDGNFIARKDGIYLVEGGKKIVDGYPGMVPLDELSYNTAYFPLRGWVYDSTGALYSKPYQLCLMYGIPMDGAGPNDDCFIKVPQPVLKLKVPQEYLSSLPAYPN